MQYMSPKLIPKIPDPGRADKALKMWVRSSALRHVKILLSAFLFLATRLPPWISLFSDGSKRVFLKELVERMVVEGGSPPYISNQPCAPQHKLKAAPPSLAKCDCNYKQQNNDVSGGQIRSKTWKLVISIHVSVSVCRELHFFCYVTFPMGKWIKISLKWGNFSNVRKRFKFDQPFWFWGYKKAHTLACPNICVRCKNCKPPGIL